MHSVLDAGVQTRVEVKRPHHILASVLCCEVGGHISVATCACGTEVWLA